MMVMRRRTKYFGKNIKLCILDFSELLSANFSVVLKVFVCESAMTSTLMLGGGGVMLQGRRMFSMVLSPPGFPNFCPAL